MLLELIKIFGGLLWRTWLMGMVPLERGSNLLQHRRLVLRCFRRSQGHHCGRSAKYAQGPRGVTANQRLSIAECLDQGGDRFSIAAISDGNGHVSQQPPSFGARNSGALEHGAEARIVQAKEVSQRRACVIV